MNSRWIRGGNVNNKMIFKVLKENPGDYTCHVEITELFLDDTRDPEAIKGELGIFDYRIKIFFQWKTIIFARSTVVSKAIFTRLWCFQLRKYPFLKL